MEQVVPWGELCALIEPAYPNLAAQIVVARDKGYFKDAGLDAAVKYFPLGGDLMARIFYEPVSYFVCARS